MKKHEKNHGLHPVQTVRGKIKSLLHNPDTLWDGFILSGAKEKELKIKFPPHLGETLRAEIQPGKEVQVDVVAEEEGEKTHFQFVSLETATGTLHHTPPKHGREKNQEEFLEIEGKIVDLVFDKENELTRFKLEDDTEVKVPPHAQKEIQTLLEINELIRVTGIFKPLKAGEVAKGQRLPLHLWTLEVNEKKYTV